MVGYQECSAASGTSKRIPTKRHVLIGATRAGSVLGGQAFAQSVAVELAPDQRTRIKEHVVKEKVKPVTVKERISVGATLPADVELRTVPSDWGLSVSKYRYIYSDNNVYFVDPTSRRVALICSVTKGSGSLQGPFVCYELPQTLGDRVFADECCRGWSGSACGLRTIRTAYSSIELGRCGLLDVRYAPGSGGIRSAPRMPAVRNE